MTPAVAALKIKPYKIMSLVIKLFLEHHPVLRLKSGLLAWMDRLNHL